MKKIAIFVQSSRDIVYSLWLYTKYNKDHQIHFYVIDHHNIYNYLDSLNLSNSTMHFIPNRPLRSPLDIAYERFRLRSLYKKHFSNNTFSDVFFFSIYFDHKTFYFVSLLSKSNNSIFFDHYGLAREQSRGLSLIGLIKIAVYFCATGKLFKISSDKNILTFDYGRHQIEKVTPEISFDDLQNFVIKPEPEKQSVILFDSNDGTTLSISNYEAIVSDILSHLHDISFSIYLKPHPRLGYSNFLRDQSVHILSSDAPSELMDLSGFDFVIGNVSAALCGCNPRQSIISIVNLLDFENENANTHYYRYLTSIDESILFPNSVIELKDILSKSNHPPRHSNSVNSF